MFCGSGPADSQKDPFKHEALFLHDDWTCWCAFFLRVIQIQAEENLARAQAILNLYNQMKVRFVELTRSQYDVQALDWSFERPIFKGSDFIRSGNIPRPTAQRILNVLKKEGILRELQPGSGSRSATLAYPQLLNIAEGLEAF